MMTVFDLPIRESKNLERVLVKDVADELGIILNFPGWLCLNEKEITLFSLLNLIEKGMESLFFLSCYGLSEELVSSNFEDMFFWIEEYGKPFSLNLNSEEHGSNWMEKASRKIHITALQAWANITYSGLAEDFKFESVEHLIPLNYFSLFDPGVKLENLGIKKPYWFPFSTDIRTIEELLYLVDRGCKLPIKEQDIILMELREKYVDQFLLEEQGEPDKGESKHHAACRFWLTRVMFRLEEKFEALTEKVKLPGDE